MTIPAITRRTFLLSSGAFAVTGMGTLRAQSDPAPARRPNVLFLVVDDLNDWCGCYGGHPQAYTPNIDRLADRGVLFERAYCAAPLCNPSRAAVMTGVHPSSSGVYGNETWFRDVPELADVRTLPQHLADHGYESSCGGKIYHRLRGRWSDPPSWSRVYSRTMGTPWPKDRLRHGVDFGHVKNNKYCDWQPLDAPDEETGDWQTADGAARLLQEQHEQPFFLACGIFRPHFPFYAPKKYFDHFPLDSIQLPRVTENDFSGVPQRGQDMARNGRDHAAILLKDQWKPAVQGYLASVAFADACLGHVLDALDASPHKDNTIVVLWSDNGHHLGDKRHWSKHTLWEQANRCPLIIAGPGTTAGGQRCSRPVGLLDLYPTINELCGIPSPGQIEGRSLLPLLRNPSAGWSHPVLMTNGAGNHAVRSENWRYIQYEDGTEELYDHRHDPLEWKNVAGDPLYAGIRDELARSLPADDAPPAASGRTG